jgi:hypothetical protein
MPVFPYHPRRGRFRDPFTDRFDISLGWTGYCHTCTDINLFTHLVSFYYSRLHMLLCI